MKITEKVTFDKLNNIKINLIDSKISKWTSQIDVQIILYHTINTLQNS